MTYAGGAIRSDGVMFDVWHDTHVTTITTGIVTIQDDIDGYDGRGIELHPIACDCEMCSAFPREAVQAAEGKAS